VLKDTESQRITFFDSLIELINSYQHGIHPNNSWSPVSRVYFPFLFVEEVYTILNLIT
jgi:hypothetical protein